MRIFTLSFITCFFYITHTIAGELTGYIALDTRVFIESPRYLNQKHNSGPTLIVSPEYFHQTENAHHIFTLHPFMRFDPYDLERTHFDIRELDWVYQQDTFEIQAGLSKIFWGVIESNHLVNIINQTDAIEDTDGEDKFGQPMIQLAWIKPFGTFRLFYLPYFRERSFPGREGRLRGMLPVNNDLAFYSSAAQEWHQDVAIRYTHFIKDWDLGVAHFSGTSREANILSIDGSLFPLYQTIDQTSLDIQYTKEGWLLKTEALIRSGHGNRFYAIATGFEYTFYQVGESNKDIGVLMEYHHDTRGFQAPATLFDHDLFMGMRLILNDTFDTELLAGTIIDLEHGSTIVNAEYAKRLSDTVKLEIDGRFIVKEGKDPIVGGIGRDSFIQVNVARYF